MATSSSARGLTAALNGRGLHKYRKPESVVDHLVIGGGVVGLAIASRLSQNYPHLSTYVVERHDHAGEEISSRNSEVIHAGLYYPSNSLKLRLCLRGKELLYDRCRKRLIPHANLGKLVVARSHQLQYLEHLYHHCQMAHVLTDYSGDPPRERTIDAELISGDHARQLEPDLSPEISHALLSHSTGIVDTHALMESLEQDIAESDNGGIAYATEVVRVDPYSPSSQSQRNLDINTREDGWVVQTITEDSVDAFLAKSLINASGLSSHLILNSLLPEPLPIFYARGSYASCKGDGARVSRLIYPVPEHGGDRHGFQSLGTHLTLDLAGNVRFGPDIEYINPPSAREANNSHNPDDIDYWTQWLSPDESRLSDMLDAIKTYLPGVTRESLQVDYVGIRPKLGGPDTGFHDFEVRKDSSHKFLPSGVSLGAPMITLLGIESPGLTSCLALAEYVEGILKAAR